MAMAIKKLEKAEKKVTPEDEKLSNENHDDLYATTPSPID